MKAILHLRPVICNFASIGMCVGEMVLLTEMISLLMIKLTYKILSEVCKQMCMRSSI
ncbi:hypothetical protein [Peptostreptococcus porci]|uniref:hypothetical protein n=1 Tax=Peptostreptococcus porci TaxID=2652282 RepID=UPI002A91C9F2|nr:hypothetical protein [Peptostreptococcus porci]MDY6231494.1 hypothetical protein [Peptostreptococcus porci]